MIETGCIKNLFQGINRGIFGLPSAKKSEIENLVQQLESQNPTPDPTLELEKVTSTLTMYLSLAFMSFPIIFVLLEGGWVLEACL